MTIPKVRLRLAKKLRTFRKKAGLTQEELAEMVDLSSRFYQMLESKKPTSLTIDTLEKLAKALKTTPSKLLDF